MRWIFICVIGFVFSITNSQNLYIEFKSKDHSQDSLIKILQPKASFKNIDALKDKFDNIVENLQHEGYFNLRYSEPEIKNDSVFIYNIQLNKKYTHLKIENHDKIPDVFKTKNEIIRSENISDFLYEILNQYSKQGKPFSQIRLKNIKISNTDTISAELSLDVSSTRTLDDIVIRGYEKFPRAFIRNYADIKKNNVFDKEKLIIKSEKLDLLRFVKQKQSPQVQFTKDSTRLYLYLERQQANSFDGFIGFSNSEENQFQLNGNIDLNLVNNFHAGEVIQLNYKNDGNAQEWFNANLRLPFLFQSKISFQAGLNFFKQDSSFSNISQNLKLDYQISPNFRLGIHALFENSSNLLDIQNTNLDISDFRKSRYGVEFFFDKPKKLNRLFLSSQFIGLNFGLGQRDTDMLAESQQYIELEARQIFKLHRRQYIYIGLNSAFLNSNQYFSNELYRFGGINSIRGFLENRFFANFYAVLQTEYRYILGSNLYIHSVLDYGFYENAIDNFNQSLYSFGFGFGLETQAGVLRLILANGGSETQRTEFRNTQIHIKFISIF